MTPIKTLALAVLVFSLSLQAAAQTPRRRGTGRPVITKPVANQPVTPPPSELAPPVVSAPRAPIPLAIVNGESITTADVDPKVRQEIEALDARIAEARGQVLELQINTLLLQSEAAKR